MPYEVLSHTADSGIEATADTLPELIGVLATGMFDLMAPVQPGKDGVAQDGAVDVEVEVEVDATTVEDLVVDILSDLLYESEAEDAILTDFDVTMVGPMSARVTARGVPMPRADMVGPPIKAVTYHDLAVEERGDGWFGRVIFDV